MEKISKETFQKLQKSNSIGLISPGLNQTKEQIKSLIVMYTGDPMTIDPSNVRLKSGANITTTYYTDKIENNTYFFAETITTKGACNTACWKLLKLNYLTMTIFFLCCVLVGLCG